MNEQLLTMNEQEQEKAEEAQKQADNMAYKKIYSMLKQWQSGRKGVKYSVTQVFQ